MAKTLEAIAEMKQELAKPRATASSFMLIGYECSGCGCRFPETRPRKGRTPAESRRLEKLRVTREFAEHVCANRGW